MTAGVFDFDALNKRVKELGIEPVYGSVEERLAKPECPRLAGNLCHGSCENYDNCQIKSLAKTALG